VRMKRGQKQALFNKSDVQTIDSTLLVPGDIILLEMGRTIPADTRLVSCQGLQSAEAALTGESVGKKKDAEFIGQEVSPHLRSIMFWERGVMVCC